MVARFDPIAEVTLDELRVELMYPLDETAERFFRNQHKPTPPPRTPHQPPSCPPSYNPAGIR